MKTTPQPDTAKMTPTPKTECCYFVMPNLPRDVWYGYPDKLEAAQLVLFTEQRHAYINPSFDAQYCADALNAKAAHARLLAENAALVKALEGLMAFHSGPKSVSEQIQLVNALQLANAALALHQSGKEGKQS